MSMLKKNITLVFITFLVVLIGLIFLYIHKNFIYEESQPISAVPINTGVVIQISQLQKTKTSLFKNTSFSGDLDNFESYNTISKVNQFIDTSSVFKSDLGSSLLDRTLIISLHPGTSTQTDWLVNIPIKSRNEEKELGKLISSIQPDVERIKFNGSTIFSLLKNKAFPIPAFVTIYRGILSISNNQDILKTSVTQRNENKTLLNDESFNNIHKTSLQSNPVSIYIHYSQLEKITKPFFNPKKLNSSFVSRIANWSELDLEISNDAISLTGFTIADKEGFFTNLFKGVSPQKPEIVQIIPADTKFLMSYTFPENNRFRDNLINLAFSGENADTYKKESNEFKNKTGVAFEETFFSFINNECALIYTEPNQLNPDGNRFLVFSTSGQAKTLEVLNTIDRNKKEAGDPTTWIELDDQTRFPVYRAPQIKLMDLFWKNIFPEVPSRYYTFYRNFIIFANSTEELRFFMYSTVLNKSLSNHPYYSSFIENFSFQENFFLFAEIPHIFSFAQKSLNPSVFHPTNNQYKALNQFYGIGLQFSSAGNLTYTSVFTNYTPQRDKEPRTIWQSRLDSTIIGKPVLVDNHITGEKEILVQDKLNNLYLINNMGRVLWKRPIEGPILSEIYQIDFYKNNKLQYLFNTAGKLYLLDRNGNYVAKYPFTLPASATNGLSVFDYDNNNEYRIFIALADNRIYLFDKNGNRNPGWNPLQTEGNVTTPIQYFSTGGRDYIVFSDQYRNYILDRRGENRVIPARSFIRNPKSLFFLEEDGSTSSLVTTTQSGILTKISLPSGECTFNELFECPKDHFFSLIDGNTSSSYVFVTENQLLSFNNEGKTELEVSFDQPILIHTDIYLFSANDIKFGIVEKNGGQIHLIDRNGKNYQRFPLKGNSRFSIGFLKSSTYRFNLIVGGNHNFLNNYRIE